MRSLRDLESESFETAANFAFASHTPQQQQQQQTERQRAGQVARQQQAITTSIRHVGVAQPAHSGTGAQLETREMLQRARQQQQQEQQEQGHHHRGEIGGETYERQSGVDQLAAMLGAMGLAGGATVGVEATREWERGAPPPRHHQQQQQRHGSGGEAGGEGETYEWRQQLDEDNGTVSRGINKRLQLQLLRTLKAPPPASSRAAMSQGRRGRASTEGNASSSSTAACAICQDPLFPPPPHSTEAASQRQHQRTGDDDDSAAVKELPKCGHAFHWGCISPWLEKDRRCPTCRKEVHHVAVP